MHLHNSVGRVLHYTPTYFRGFNLCAFSGRGFTYAQFSDLHLHTSVGRVLPMVLLMHLHNAVGGVLLMHLHNSVGRVLLMH